jgi:hypothetical protein
MTAETELVRVWISVRPEVIEALDALAEEIGKDAMQCPMGAPSRSEMARMAMLDGMKAMQAKLKRGGK